MAKLHIAPLALLLVAPELSCTLEDNESPTYSADTELRVSVALPGSIDIQRVSVQLEPCDDEDNASWLAEIDAGEFILPDGGLAPSPSDYDYALAENAFVDVLPGCYDVIAAPILGGDADQLDCKIFPITIDIKTGDSTVLDLSVTCSKPARVVLDPLEADLVNTPPVIDSLTVSEDPSACDIVEVCATVHDDDDDMVEFDWSQPPEFVSSPTQPWPVITHHSINTDGSLVQCIAVQAELAGAHQLNLDVYDMVSIDSSRPYERIEDVFEGESHASQSVVVDATLGCTNTARSAVILMTLGNDPGLHRDDALTLVSNTLNWTLERDSPPIAEDAQLLVVLDNNHHGEDAEDGEYVVEIMEKLGYTPDYRVEPAGGLEFEKLEQYDLVWFVNPGYEMNLLPTYQALNRYRQAGGALILQGDDIARFRGDPAFMTPMTYLGWKGNGTVACGAHIDNNRGDSYTVTFGDEAGGVSHPIAAGLEGLSFQYGNDIDLTRGINKGEQVVAWASYETRSCALRTPAIVALDPELLELPY